MMIIEKDLLTKKNNFFKNWNDVINFYNYDDGPVNIKLIDEVEIDLNKSTIKANILASEYLEHIIKPNGFKIIPYYVISTTALEYIDYLYLYIIGVKENQYSILGICYLGEVTDLGIAKDYSINNVC